jgi:nucleoside-diphosphate-sugar epimerase
MLKGRNSVAGQKVLVTGASGIGGQEVSRQLAGLGYKVRMADMVAPPPALRSLCEFVRCDTRTFEDAQTAVAGVDAVIHLAAWHCAHQPPVSDPTIFAVNVGGTYNILEAARLEGVKAVVYASSMAYGHGWVYGVTKVIGEDLCHAYHNSFDASVAILRFHDFVPKPYLAFGEMLLRNGVDRRDVASASVAALGAALERRIGLFMTIVHTNHGMPPEVVNDCAGLGPDWFEQEVPGAKSLIAKYGISLPKQVEQHDLSEAKRVLGWKPRIGFLDFLRDLKERDARGEDVANLWAPGQLPDAS